MSLGLDLQCYCLLPKHLVLVLVLDWTSTWCIWCHPSTACTWNCTCTCKFEKYLYLTQVLDPNPGVKATYKVGRVQGSHCALRDCRMELWYAESWVFNFEPGGTEEVASQSPTAVEELSPPGHTFLPVNKSVPSTVTTDSSPLCQPIPENPLSRHGVPPLESNSACSSEIRTTSGSLGRLLDAARRYRTLLPPVLLWDEVSLGCLQGVSVARITCGLRPNAIQGGACRPVSTDPLEPPEVCTGCTTQTPGNVPCISLKGLTIKGAWSRGGRALLLGRSWCYSEGLMEPLHVSMTLPYLHTVTWPMGHAAETLPVPWSVNIMGLV